jgi:hypothetical protein
MGRVRDSADSLLIIARISLDGRVHCCDEFLRLRNLESCGSRTFKEIARNVVESQRPSTLIDYAIAAPFANGFFETALAIEDSSKGIWR